MKKLYIVMDEAFEYEYYNKNVIKKGARFAVGRGRGGAGVLQDDGFVLIIGHGADVLIPREKFHLEEVEKIVKVKEVRRRV